MSTQTILAFLKTLDFGPWAASGIILLFFFESAPMTGLFLPGIFLMVALGSVVHTGYFSFADAILYASIGAVLGDSLGYWLGRLGANTKIVTNSIHRNNQTHRKISHMIQQYGAFAVFIGRFAWLIHPLMPLAAGISRIRPIWFYLADIPAAVLWVLLYGAIGHFATGLARRRALEFFIGIGAIILIALAVLIVRHFRKKSS